ncbi:MAG: hypothetical protein HY595_04180, partial [Candidatus Omnitrophica bacterium]|nr:hypothetical protein [Candidatus Omnitrophota bacterium]
ERLIREYKAEAGRKPWTPELWDDLLRDGMFTLMHRGLMQDEAIDERVSTLTFNRAIMPVLRAVDAAKLGNATILHLKSFAPRLPSETEAAKVVLAYLRDVSDAKGTPLVPRPAWQTLREVLLPDLDIETLPVLPGMTKALNVALEAQSPSVSVIYAHIDTQPDFEQVKPRLNAAIEQQGGRAAKLLVLIPHAGMIDDSAQYTRPLAEDRYADNDYLKAEWAKMIARFESEFRATEEAFRLYRGTPESPAHLQSDASAQRQIDGTIISPFTRALLGDLDEKAAQGYDIEIAYERNTPEGGLHLTRALHERLKAMQALWHSNVAGYLAHAAKHVQAFASYYRARNDALLVNQLPGLTESGRCVIVIRPPMLLDADPAAMSALGVQAPPSGSQASIRDLLLRKLGREQPLTEDDLLRDAIGFLFEASVFIPTVAERVNTDAWHQVLTPIIQALPPDQVRAFIAAFKRAPEPIVFLLGWLDGLNIPDVTTHLPALYGLMGLPPEQVSRIQRVTLAPLPALASTPPTPGRSATKTQSVRSKAEPELRPSGQAAQPAPPVPTPILTPPIKLVELGLKIGAGATGLPDNSRALAELFDWSSRTTDEKQTLLSRHHWYEPIESDKQLGQRIRHAVVKAFKDAASPKIKMISSEAAGRQRIEDVLKTHRLAIGPLLVGKREEDVSAVWTIAANQAGGQPVLCLPVEVVRGMSASMVAELIITEMEPSLLRTQNQRMIVFPEHYPKGKPDEFFTARRLQLIRRSKFQDGVEELVFQLVQFIAPWLQTPPVSYEEARDRVLHKERESAASAIVNTARDSPRFKDAVKRLEGKQSRLATVVQVAEIGNQMGLWELLLRDLNWSMRLDLANGDMEALARRARVARLIQYLWDLSAEAPLTPQAQFEASWAAQEAASASQDVTAAANSLSSRVREEIATITTALGKVTTQPDEALLSAVASAEGVERLPELQSAGELVVKLLPLKALCAAMNGDESLTQTLTDIATAERIVPDAIAALR